MLEQSLPRGQARDWQARAHREVDVARQRREVACLDGRVLRQGAVAIPVREAEHPPSHRQPRRAIAERRDHAGELVSRNRRCSIAAEAIGPGRRPRQLRRDESRRMNLNDDVVYRRLRLGPLHQRHPGRSCSLVRHYDRLHRRPPCPIVHVPYTGSHGPASRHGVGDDRNAKIPATSACAMTAQAERANSISAGPRQVNVPAASRRRRA